MKLKFLLLFAALYSCLPIFAQSGNYKNQIGFRTDNDGLLARGSDRYYTAGNFFNFRHALKLKDSVSLKNKVLGIELGQKIYTPQSAFISGPAYIDRPFAGYLYLGTSLNLLYKNESNLKLEAQLGVVGPNSFAEQVQYLIHSTFHFYKPGGWQYQVQSDYEINLSAQYNFLAIRRRGFDISVNSYADLGTGLTGAGGGFTARFGKFNPLFNSVTAGSSVSAYKSASSSKTEAFVYAKPYISFIAYDATIQGSLFSDAPGLNEYPTDKVPVVLSEQFGGSLVTGHWLFDLSATYQTRTTPKMVHRPGHQWGSVNLAYRF
jgi:lipid A 3-O-deacylase